MCIQVLNNNLYEIIDSKFTLKNNLMFKNTAYKFILTVNVDDVYKAFVGNAPEGYAHITVYDGPIPHYGEKELTIE